MPGSLVAANWFGDRRGFAIGVTIAGGLMGGVIMPPVIDRLLGLSISSAYFTLAIMVLLIPTTLILAFIRTRPAGAIAVGPTKQLDSLPGLELSPALRTRQFWILVAVQVGHYRNVRKILLHGSVPDPIRLCLLQRRAGDEFHQCRRRGSTVIMGALCDRFTGRKVLPLIAIQLGISSFLLLGARASTGWAFYIGAFLLLFGLVVGFATIVPVVLAELLD